MAQTTVTTPDVLGPNLGSGYGPQFGHALAAGDFDGDTKREVAVSTWEMMHEDFPSNDGVGHVYVYEYDSSWSGATEVPNPDAQPLDCVFFGYAMTAGDVDGDGDDELVISAPGGEGAGALENGAVYIYDWNSQTSAFVLAYKFRSDPSYGGQQGDNFGWSMALGDFNGDSDLDLLVGARYWSECEDCIFDSNGFALEDWTGAAYVFDNDNWVAAGTDWNDVEDADLVIRGEAGWSPDLNPNGEQTRGYFGARVACVGDVNDDGNDDFIIAATGRTPEDFATCTTQFDYYDEYQQYEGHAELTNDCRVGTVYLFAGGTPWSSVDQDAGSLAKVIFEGEDAEDKFGQGLASQGDLNGDGVNDIVISSNLHTETAQNAVGRVYVFLLPDYSSGWPGVNDKVWSAEDANIIIDGPTNDNIVQFGFAMACDGNTDKQTSSRADLIVGAPRGKSPCGYSPSTLDENRGFAYLYRYTGSMSVGKNGGHITWAAIADSSAYYRIDCGATYNKSAPELGRSIAFIGDADGATNSNDEFIIGSPGWDYATYPTKDDRGGIYMIAH